MGVYRRLTEKQVDVAALKIVKFVRSKVPLEFADAVAPFPGYDTVSTSVELEDSPVGKVLFSMSFDDLGLFLHVRVRDPKRFTYWNDGYNHHSGKFNLHRHRAQYRNFDEFLTACQMDAVEHIQEILNYEAKVAA